MNNILQKMAAEEGDSRQSGPRLNCDPSKCHLTGNTEGRYKVTLNAVDYEGKGCDLPISSLECDLFSDILGTRVLCRTERIEESKYEISYQPTIKGGHHLHIKVEGQHIRGSPFAVAVKSSIEKLGNFVLHTIKGEMKPFSVALTPKQALVVSDVARDCIRVFSPSGKELLSFGSSGTGQGQFSHPNGVAVDGEGNIYVVDSSNNRVQKFTPEGKFLASSVVKIKKRLLCGQPRGIAFNDSNNKVYVTDGFNNRIIIFNDDLSFFGSIEGYIRYPSGIAFDTAKTGNIYVSVSDSIKVFTAEGKFLNEFGRYGPGEGEFNAASDVAVDSNGMVYVSETNNYRVSIFNSEGQFVKMFGSEGSEPGQFQNPYGLAVDSSGVVYVCDMANHRIQMF